MKLGDLTLNQCVEICKKHKEKYNGICQCDDEKIKCPIILLCDNINSYNYLEEIKKEHLNEKYIPED